MYEWKSNSAMTLRMRGMTLNLCDLRLPFHLAQPMFCDWFFLNIVVAIFAFCYEKNMRRYPGNTTVTKHSPLEVPKEGERDNK